MTGERFDKIIAFAIQEEKNAAELYQKYSEIVVSRTAKQLLVSMSQKEIEHQNKLERYSQKMDKKIVATKMVADLRLSDFMVDTIITSQSAVEDAIVFAIKAELYAEKLYTILATAETDPEVKTFFQTLSQEEKKHRLDLENAFEQVFMKDN